MNRRNFLKATAAISAGIASSSIMSKRIVGSKPTTTPKECLVEDLVSTGDYSRKAETTLGGKMIHARHPREIGADEAKSLNEALAKLHGDKITIIDGVPMYDPFKAEKKKETMIDKFNKDKQGINYAFAIDRIIT